MNRFFLATLLISFTVISGKAQDADTGLFEQRVREAYAKACPSTVKLTQLDSLGNEGGSGSGVVVSPDGLILTVAHVNEPGGKFLVTFPDGRKATACGLGSIVSHDAAMVRIQEEGTYPFSPVGRSANLQKGQPCIALGYAAGLKIGHPALRLGFVVACEKPQAQRRRLQTTCLMEPGDSGGPVFDLEGRVIGLRTSINRSLDQNFEVPMDVFLEYWDFLLSGKTSVMPPEGEGSPIPDAVADPDDKYVSYNDIKTVLLAHAAGLPEECYKITSTLGDSSVYASCTPLRMDGVLSGKALRKKSYLLSKSSIVGADPTVAIGGETAVKARAIYRDTARDLVLLEIPVRLRSGLADISSGVEQLTESQVGTFLFSVLPDDNRRISVAGTVPFAIEDRSRGGYLGAMLKQGDDGIFFVGVNDNSPAKKAGLAAGQKLVSIDGIQTTTTDEFVDIIRSKSAGDTTLLKYLDRDSLVSSLVVLSYRPMATYDHIAERFEGGKSLIRDGFDHVFTHDARIRPEECGSPVLDCSGRFYGINISRVSRTATLVMPVEEIRSFLHDFLGNDTAPKRNK